MASIITIILFFVYLWGLGFTGTYFLKRPQNFYERQFLYLGIGMGIFPILAILLNFLHLPLDWKIFLFLSMVFPVYHVIKSQFRIKNKLNFLQKITNTASLTKITKSSLMLLIVVLIALFSFHMYTKGAFSYPYLENEDPWGHAVGIRYVALEKNAYDPPLENVRKMDPVLSYIDPYPPAYDIFLGILHQTSPDINWMMKFFNALIISLSLIFFYLFIKQFMGSKAVLATFFLAAIPSYMSHFIWAHSMVIALFFPTMYAFYSIQQDKKWTYLALILVASIWVTQNLSQPMKLSTMILIYLVVVSVCYNKFDKHGFAALFGGIGLSFLWWGAMIYRHGLTDFLAYFDVGKSAGAGITVDLYTAAVPGTFSFGEKVVEVLKNLVSSGGSGSRTYGFDDFFYAQGQNVINNPVGIGGVLTLLVLMGVIFVLWHYKSSLVNKDNMWRTLALFWLIFTFWGVNGETFHISIARGAFRVWMLLAIPVAMLAAESSYFLSRLFRNKLWQKGLILLIIIGVVYTSGMQKYELNTITWPTAGAFTSSLGYEPFEYGFWFQSLEPGTKVFLYAPRDKITIGFGGHSCLWCQEVIDFRKDILERDAQEVYNFLKENDYKYFIINGPMDKKYLQDQEKLIQRYNEFQASGLFIPVAAQENRYLIFEVR